MPEYDLDNLKLGAWDITWNDFFAGAVDDCAPLMDLLLKEKKVGSLGPAVLGHWVTGMTGMPTSDHREITIEQYQTLMPWWDGSGDIPISPAGYNPDLYQYAQFLNFHPNELPPEQRTLDINYYKAVPLITPPTRNGDTPDVIKVKWQVYPDRSKIATGTPILLAYGYIGAPPSPPPPPPPG